MKTHLHAHCSDASRRLSTRLAVAVIRSMLCWVSGQTQRAMYIGSLYGVLNHTSDPKPDALQRIVDALKLSQTQAALQWPAAIHATLWYGENIEVAIDELCHGKDLESVMREPEGRECLKRLFIERCPDWFRYGRADDMRRDLDVLLDPELVLA